MGAGDNCGYVEGYAIKYVLAVINHKDGGIMACIGYSLDVATDLYRLFPLQGVNGSDFNYNLCPTDNYNFIDADLFYKVKGCLKL